MKQPRKLKKRIQKAQFARQARYAGEVYSNIVSQSKGGNYKDFAIHLIHLALRRQVVGEMLPRETLCDLGYADELTSSIFDDNNSLRIFKFWRESLQSKLLKSIVISSTQVALGEKAQMAKSHGSELPVIISMGGLGQITKTEHTSPPSTTDWLYSGLPYWRENVLREFDFTVRVCFTGWYTKGINLKKVRSTPEAITALQRRAAEIAIKTIESIIRSLKEEELSTGGVDRRSLIRTITRPTRIQPNDGKEEDNAMASQYLGMKLYLTLQNPSTEWRIYSKNNYCEFGMRLAS